MLPQKINLAVRKPLELVVAEGHIFREIRESIFDPCNHLSVFKPKPTTFIKSKKLSLSVALAPRMIGIKKWRHR